MLQDELIYGGAFYLYENYEKVLLLGDIGKKHSLEDLLPRFNLSCLKRIHLHKMKLKKKNKKSKPGNHV